MCAKLLRAVIVLIIMLKGVGVFGQTAIKLYSTEQTYPLTENKLMLLPDTANRLTIDQVSTPAFDSLFVLNNKLLPRIEDTEATVWVKIKLHNPTPYKQQWYLEFYDSGIEHIAFYDPKNNGGFSVEKTGNRLLFYQKSILHKNYVFPVELDPNHYKTVYAQVKSQKHNFLYGVVRSPGQFVNYALSEYYYLGVFYGLLAFIIIYSLFMSVTVRRKTFFFYSLYVLANAFYSLSLDGMGYQFFWSRFPDVNSFVSELSIFLMVVFLLEYARNFLKLWSLSPRYNLVVQYLIIIRTLFFILYIIWPKSLSYLGILPDAIPMLFLYFASLLTYKRGYKLAGYFIVGFTLLFAGFIISNLTINSIFGFSLPNNIFTVYAINFATLAQLMLLTFALAESFRLVIKEKDQAQKEIIDQLKVNARIREQAQAQLEDKVKQRTAEVEAQKQQLEDKNKRISAIYEEITDNIRTAKLIQQSILPSIDKIKEAVNDCFIFFKPRDIVTGDFYWLEETKDSYFLAAADCTGHGVAGAFMSIIGYDLLNQVVRSNPKLSPAQVLNRVNKQLQTTINQDKGTVTIKDGMDIALIKIWKNTNQLEYAGAYNPLYYVVDNELTQIKGDRFSIGMPRQKLNRIPISFKMDRMSKSTNFTNHEIQIPKDKIMQIYLFSDGYADQIGGPDGNQKYMYPRFRSFLKSISTLPASQQEEIIKKDFEKWRGNLEQLDDVLVMGLKIL